VNRYSQRAAIVQSGWKTQSVSEASRIDVINEILMGGITMAGGGSYCFSYCCGLCYAACDQQVGIGCVMNIWILLAYQGMLLRLYRLRLISSMKHIVSILVISSLK